MTVYIIMVVLHIYASSSVPTSFNVVMGNKRPTLRTNKAPVPIIPSLVPVSFARLVCQKCQFYQAQAQSDQTHLSRGKRCSLSTLA